MTAEDLIEQHGLDEMEATDTIVAFLGHEWVVEILAHNIDQAGLLKSFSEWLNDNH